MKVTASSEKFPTLSISKLKGGFFVDFDVRSTRCYKMNSKLQLVKLKEKPK